MANSQIPPGVQGIGKRFQEKIKESARKRKQEIERLKQLSKPLHELVSELYFKVNKTHRLPYKYIPQNPLDYFGGPNRSPRPSPLESEGMTSPFVLYVTPNNPSISIQIITFDNGPIAKPGDDIYALIPKCEEETIRDYFDKLLNSPIYLPRENFNIKEKAIYIGVLNEAREIVESADATNRYHFLKQNS